jgi:hypothetical protein
VLKNRWTWWILIMLGILLVAAGALARQGEGWPRLRAGQGGASLSPTSDIRLAVTRAGAPAGMSALYLIHDWRLGSHSASDWRQTYPGWPETGGWIEATWEELNPAPGVYDFSRLIEYVETAARSPHNRPTAISVMLHGRDENEAMRLADWTPAWVYDGIDGHTELAGRPVGHVLQPEGCDRPAAMPMYDDPIWQLRLEQLVAALAGEFDDPQRYAGLQAISIGWGFEDLDEPTHDLVCAYAAQLTPEMRQGYEAWTGQMISTLARQFSHRRIWLTATPSRAARRAGQIASAGAPNLGLIIVQPAAETDIPFAPELLPTAESLPIGWRLTEPDSLAQTYWGLMGALAQGATWIDIQWAHLLTVQTIQQDTGFDLLAFAQTCAGHTDDYPQNAWALFSPSVSPAPNAFAAGLTPDIKLQDRVTTLAGHSEAASRFGNLPLQITSGWGTDASRGLNEVAFDLSAGWPASAPATLRIIYLDRGQDALELIYPLSGGRLARRSVTKTDSGQWMVAEFPIREPAWDTPGVHDLRIVNRADGDEWLHLVEIRQSVVKYGQPSDVEAAGWEIVTREQAPTAVDPAATDGATPSAGTPHFMQHLLGVPLLVWLLGLAALGIVFLAVRLLIFRDA